MCSSKPPKPDPMIGQAAMANADLAREMAGVAREQLAWEKNRAAVQDPLLQKVVDQQIDSGDANAKRAESQWQIYRDLFAPVEEQMVEDANNWDSNARKEQMAAEAGADVTRGYAGARDQNERAMERMGVNPNSGRFAGLTNETNLGQAKDTAGAMNAARRGTEQQGLALRTGAAQFGRNMPNTGIAADSLSLNAGSAATNNMATGAGIHNTGMNTAGNLFGGAQSGNSSAGQIGLGLYGNQLSAWNNQQQNKLGMLQGVGQLAGTLGGAAMFAGMRKGGMIRGKTAYRLKPGLRRQGYAEGGMIEGPGTPSSDSIPAVIEGENPVALSNGEAVLNAEAVELVGEDFVHRINAGGLAAFSGKRGVQQPAATSGLTRRVQ